MLSQTLSITEAIRTIQRLIPRKPDATVQNAMWLITFYVPDGMTFAEHIVIDLFVSARGKVRMRRIGNESLLVFLQQEILTKVNSKQKQKLYQSGVLRQYNKQIKKHPPIISKTHHMRYVVRNNVLYQKNHRSALAQVTLDNQDIGARVSIYVQNKTLLMAILKYLQKHYPALRVVIQLGFPQYGRMPERSRKV